MPLLIVSCKRQHRSRRPSQSPPLLPLSRSIHPAKPPVRVLIHENGKGSIDNHFSAISIECKKRYGNLQGEEYLKWFINLAPTFNNLLADDGSLVIEIGNSWEQGRPVQSLLHLECLLGLANNSNSDLRLIQEFIAYNPSR